MLPSILPVRSNCCWAPPARPAWGRSGCANRRCLVATTRRALLRFAAFLARLVARTVVADAGAVGLASLAGSESSRATALRVVVRSRGAG